MFTLCGCVTTNKNGGDDGCDNYDDSKQFPLDFGFVSFAFAAAFVAGCPLAFHARASRRDATSNAAVVAIAAAAAATTATGFLFCSVRAAVRANYARGGPHSFTVSL